MLSATFRYTETSKDRPGGELQRLSHALLTVYQGAFLTIRVTYVSDEPRGEDALKAFLFDLEKLLD